MIKFEAWCNCEGTGVMPVPYADMYVICNICDGVGTITIQEENMEEETNTNPQISQEYFDDKGKPFAYEEYVELKKTYQEVRDRVFEVREELRKTRELVRDFFQQRYEDNDYFDYFNIDVEDINALLADIKATPLSKVFDAGATIELVIKVHAESAEDADAIIRDHLDSIDWSFYGNDSDEIEVESIDVNVSE